MDYEQNQTIEEVEGVEQPSSEQNYDEVANLYVTYIEHLAKRKGHTPQETEQLIEAAAHIFENPSNSYVFKEPSLQASFNEFLRLYAHIENNPEQAEAFLNQEILHQYFEICKPHINEQFQSLAKNLILAEASLKQNIDIDIDYRDAMSMLYSYLSEEEYTYDGFIGVLEEGYPKLKEFVEKFSFYFERFTQEDYKQLLTE